MGGTALKYPDRHRSEIDDQTVEATFKCENTLKAIFDLEAVLSFLCMRLIVFGVSPVCVVLADPALTPWLLSPWSEH